MKERGNGKQAEISDGSAENGTTSQNSKLAAIHDSLPHLHLAKKAPDRREEDEEIFTFFKKYIALLTAVGSLPLLTAGIDVLNPPGSAGKKLSVISSLACVIVLGVCILFKSTFANLSLSPRIWARMTPPLLASGFLMLGIILTAQHAAGHALAGFPLHNAEITYLLVLPAFVAALGITLMALYSQFRGSQLARTIDESFVGGEQINEMKSMIRSCAQILGASTIPEIQAFHRAMLGQIQAALGTLSIGWVESKGRDVAELQKTMFEHFNRSFFAVSDRDVKFWLNAFAEHTKLNNLTAKECLRLNVEAIGAGVTVTRLFIFDDNDFNGTEDGIVSILKKHHETGIGWALLLHEELPARLKVGQRSLDFAIIDRGNAVAMFNNSKADQRQFYLCLNVPANQPRIAEYVRLHKELVNQCWLGSTRFCQAHQLQNSAMPLEKAIVDNDQRPHAINFGSGKIVVVDTAEEISRAVTFVRRLRRKNMLYWDEVMSRDVTDLDGTWRYSLNGQDAHGKKFEHRGICRGLIQDKEAYLKGARHQTTGADGAIRPIDPPAPWESSRIEFSHNGWIEFKSNISIDGIDVRGVARLQFAEDRAHLTGGIDYIVGPGRAVHAEVEMERYAA